MEIRCRPIGKEGLVSRPRVGIQIAASTPPADLGAIAAEAERLGYGEIWLAEDCFELGGIASVGIALAATERIPVGLGIVAGGVRHPAVTAMEFATLGRTYPGRFLGGIGHGVPGWMSQMGLEPASPLRSLREALASTRRLLDGEKLTEVGEYFTFDNVHLDHAPDVPVPLYLGVHGPASLRLSGELAEGTLLGWFSSPGYVAWARERIDEGRTRAGRSDHHHLVTLSLLSVSDDDGSAANRHLGRWAAPMLAQMTKSPQFTTSPEGAELVAYLAAAAEADEPADLPANLLSRFGAAGDAATCAATIQSLLDAGSDRVVLVPNPGGFRTTAEMIQQIHGAARLIERVGGRAVEP
jgi:alkanesulfonate monooxygenase SsuD/methylene tetrahydromethanopterin reductase-like flavin-dependent oxidoreductase (luciferase family)